jgi:Uma2 family endonuclease
MGVMSSALAEPPVEKTEVIEPDDAISSVKASASSGKPSVATVKPLPRPARPSRTFKRFSVREFEKLDELGMLPQRVELVDGWILEMEPVNNPHGICHYWLNLALTPVATPPRFLRSQGTHRFGSGWCPMPDFALLDEFPKAKALIDPLPRLVIEISETSLSYDLGEKRLRYAAAGVAEYWVADLSRQLLHVFRDPVVDAPEPELAWRDASILKPGDIATPLCLPDLEVKVGDVMPDIVVP